VLLGSRNYTTSIDIWSIGCIMAEMYTGKPLFPGKTNEDQLLRIFQMFGTPNEATWPRVTEFSEYKINFPIYQPMDIRAVVPTIEPLGIDLLSRMLQYQPHLRISAKDALSHLYFRDLLVMPQQSLQY
jgi:negative regulator of PHO system